MQVGRCIESAFLVGFRLQPQNCMFGSQVPTLLWDHDITDGRSPFTTAPGSVGGWLQELIIVVWKVIEIMKKTCESMRNDRNPTHFLRCLAT